MTINLLLKKGIWLSFLVAVLISACSKMDDTYKEFIQDGQIKYVGKADNAVVQPGRNRLVLSWPVPSDPKAVKAKVYWNNRTDSIEVPIVRTTMGKDTVKVLLNNLAEAPYVFEIVTFDENGNRSVKVEARGRVYGDQYEAMLLSRPIDKAELYVDTLRIEWGASSDTTVIGSEIVFKDKNSIEQTLFVSGRTLLTNVLNFVPQTFRHRTVYLPSRLSIDTFYTPYTSIRIKGQPIELSKTGWTATASSFDNRSGASNRPPSNAIDGNPVTIWVNQIVPQMEYPHTITVDMKSIQENIEGFVFITRLNDPASRPKTVELLLSEDNENWESFGNVDLASVSTKQFISLPDVKRARYFRVIAKNAHDNGKNIAMAEVGLYTR